MESTSRASRRPLRNARSRLPAFWLPELSDALALAALALRRVDEFRRRRADADALRAMTERDLRDMGLSRMDAQAIAAGIYDRKD
ncbi:MAG TPA: DUF1127 domain-containing protein [Azospirillum sp.]|nr:DUF1127 domain-containing protein [Azospirillum sp.]